MNRPSYTEKVQAAIDIFCRCQGKRPTPPCSPLLTSAQRKDIITACQGLYYYYSPDMRAPAYFISDHAGIRRIHAGQVRDILKQRGMTDRPASGKSENTMIDHCFIYLATIKRVHIANN